MIMFRDVCRRYNDKMGKVLEPFLSDAEAKHIIDNLTQTSKDYLRMKKNEAEKEFGDKLTGESYRVFRDCVLAEVCGLELNDPRIRQVHNLPPAE